MTLLAADRASVSTGDDGNQTVKPPDDAGSKETPAKRRERLREERRANERAVYQARKEAGLCTRCGATLPDDWEHGLCTVCQDYQQTHTKLAVRALRLKRRRKKQCVRCGLPSKRYECLICLSKLGRLPKSAFPSDGNQTVKQARIAARLIPWENSPQNAGRLRLRGGKRGRMSIEQENRTDLDFMEKDLARARTGEQFANSAEVQAMPPIQRIEARRAAMDHVALLVRTGIELLKRNKHPLAARYTNKGDSADEDDT